MSKEIKISIKNRWTGSIIFEYSSVDNTLAKTVAEALKGGADLSGAILRGADLSDADLSDANLSRADLSGADLCGAILRDADLSDADLSDANLSGADLRGANLRGANLRGANMSNVEGAYMACPTDGSFVGWKKASKYIVKLQIPEDARRGSAGGEKCR